MKALFYPRKSDVKRVILLLCFRIVKIVINAIRKIAVSVTKISEKLFEKQPKKTENTKANVKRSGLFRPKR